MIGNKTKQRRASIKEACDIMESVLNRLQDNVYGTSYEHSKKLGCVPDVIGEIDLLLQKVNELRDMGDEIVVEKDYNQQSLSNKQSKRNKIKSERRRCE